MTRCLLQLLVYSIVIVVVVAAEEKNNLPDATIDGIDKVKTWAKQRIQTGEKLFDHSGLSRQSSPDHWETKVVYQIMVDRFNNGNVTNDAFNVPQEQQQKQHTNDPEGLPDYRHGGDIQGIIDRLDYFQDLHVDTLWITPLLHHNGQYHGYCTTDLTNVDPGFGTAEELQKLVHLAHTKGISIILDIVINHLCDIDTSYQTKQPDHTNCANELSSNYWSGKSGQAPSRGELSFSKSFFPPFKTSYFFNQCGPDSSQEMQGEDPAAVFGDFTNGMFDYDTMNNDWQQIFTDLMKYWVAYADIDGFRLDAAKHVTDDFLAYFSTEIREYAKSLGKNNFMVLGEVAADSDWEGRALGRMMSNPNDPKQHGNVPGRLTEILIDLNATYLKNNVYPLPGLNSIYDFDESGTSRSALLCNRPSADVAKYFNSQDYKTIIAQTLSQVQCNECFTLLEIHDWTRFLSSNMDRIDLLMSGFGYLLTAPGIPIIYYGMEQGFNGNCPSVDHMNAGDATTNIEKECQQSSNSDALKRQDMFQSGVWRLQSSVKSINKLSYVGFTTPRVSPIWTNDPFLDRTHNLYQLARKLSALRKSCMPLAFGNMVWKDASNSNGGVLAYSRVSDIAEMLIIVNPGGTGAIVPTSYPIDKQINTVSGEKYVNVFAPSQIAHTSVSGQDAILNFPENFNILGGSLAIFAHINNVLQFDKTLQISLCKSS